MDYNISSNHEWLDGASVNTEYDYYATPLGHVKVDVETAQEEGIKYVYLGNV